MSKIDEYRAYAVECRRLAARTVNADDKQQWNRVADAWLRLVETLDEPTEAAERH
jgi:hypothetical protein